MTARAACAEASTRPPLHSRGKHIGSQLQEMRDSVAVLCISRAQVAKWLANWLRSSCISARNLLRKALDMSVPA